MVSANSVLTKGCPKGNVLLVGSPAIVKKVIPAWYMYQSSPKIMGKVEAVEKLKVQMGIG